MADADDAVPRDRLDQGMAVDHLQDVHRRDRRVLGRRRRHVLQDRLGRPEGPQDVGDLATGVLVEDIATTSKTFPDFASAWSRAVLGTAGAGPGAAP